LLSANPEPGQTSPPPSPWRHFALNIISPSVLTFVLFLGLIFVVIIPAMRRNMVDRKKEMIRELTQVAWSEIAGLHEQEKSGALTRPAAQQAAIARIRGLRFGDDGKDYFWICDMQPRMVMHPYRPELDGRDLSDYSDPAGNDLFVEAVRLVRASGDGYIEYVWQWKDDAQRVGPKLSYVKGFGPWNWIVGTGIYLEDVRAEFNEVIWRVLQASAGFLVLIGGLLVYITKQGHKLETQRWRAAAALGESEEKYRLLVEGATEGILLVMQGRPVYANRTLLDLVGCTQEELSAMPLDRILESVPARGASEERRAKLFTSSGDTHDVLLADAPITLGERSGQILFLKDAATRRKTQDAMARLLAELQSMLPLATRPIRSSTLSMISCELDTPASRAAALMAQAKSSAIVVKAPGGEPVGIVTDQDLRNRVLAAGVGSSVPVSRIMSAPLTRITDHALLFEAAQTMQEHNIQHLVVTDDRGEAIGVLNGSEILHGQRHALALLLSEIKSSLWPESLKESQAKLPVFVKALLESGARVEHITRIMSTVSDAIMIRLIELAEAELGPPPAPYSFIVMGSPARDEQTLATDQDNAIVYSDIEPEREDEVRRYFLKLGERVCDWLDLAGYRKCKGNTMASNPRWCQPMSRWREYLTSYVTVGTPQDLLDVNIVFDFRCARGEARHIAELRGHLRDLLKNGQAAFFFHLADSTLRFKPPVGFFGNIQIETSGRHAAAFNIKSAIIPLVNFARIYALRQGYEETNTLARLRRLRDDGILLPSSHDELVQAYAALMQMRLAHQATQWSEGVEPDNQIDLRKLTALERMVLKKVFADITVFQARLETDFARTR
jgi:PAS domain S-box-containing protein